MWRTNLTIVMVVLGTLGLYTAVAMSIPQVESEVPEELSFSGEVSAGELVAAGEELFDGAGGCTACHGTGTRAPNLRAGEGDEGPIGARCGDRVPGEDCKVYLYQSMVEPAAHVVEGYAPIMPDASRTMSETQIWAMVAYLQDLGGEVTVTAEDIESTYGDAEGAPGGGEAPPSDAAGSPGGGGAPAAEGGTDPVALMENNLCLNCHTMDGEGIDLGPSFDGIGSRLSESEIRASILDPNADAAEGFDHLVGAMPTNFGEIFSAAQLEAIVTHLAGRE